MLRLGNLTIDAPFYQAGLAGYSDGPMRRVARRHGCPYCITEAMLDQFLIAGGKGRAAAELHAEDHPICGQLMGSHPAEIAAGAKVLVEMGYDVVDVNLACPVKKIRKKARGGHLLSVPGEACDILSAVADAVGADVPLTTKLRRSFDDTPEMEAAFHRVIGHAINIGFSGATVHARTVEQKYVGPSNWNLLRGIAQRYGNESIRPCHFSGTASATPAARFVLGGSGDIWTARDIFRMLNATGVHWVSVARGCIGNPWLFHQARAIMRGDHEAAARPPTIHQQRAVLLEHYELSVELHGEVPASRMMRKFGIRFARHHPDGEAVRQAFIAAKDITQWHAAIATHYEHDGPGVRTDEALPDEATPAACEPALAA